MRNQRGSFLLLGMLASIIVFALAIAGFVSIVRGEKAAAVAAPAADAPAEVPSATPSPVPISSVDVHILMYHHLDNDGVTLGTDYQQLSVPPEDFREQMAWLKSNGYHTITFAQLGAAFRGESTLPANPVIITFDDGWDDIYHEAYPILREHGQVATFFISTNWIDNLEGTVEWPQIKEMSDGGMEFGSHSSTHPYLTQSEPEMLTWELKASKTALEKATGKTITALAYPFGLYDDRVIAAAREIGYLTACTIDPGHTARAGELMTLPRLWVYGWYDLEDFAQVLKSS